MKIHLINMPFSAVELPSLALTQLKSVLIQRFGERVSVEVHYLNLDVANYLGFELYRFLCTGNEASNTGVGDWFFRQSAFPDLADNTDLYYRRYFPSHDPQVETLKRLTKEKRLGLDALLDDLIDKYQLDQANVVGFTSMFFQNVASFALARGIKERNARTVTVIGGANCETPMGQEIAKNVKQIDYVFSGPALKSFPRLVEHLIDHPLEECSNIVGVFSKSNYRDQPPRTAIGEELDINVDINLDYESYMKAVEENFPNGEVRPMLLFETSRGCWWGEKSHCTFCGLNGTTMGYRAMGADKARSLISSLFGYSDRVECIESVDNIMPKEYLKDLFPTLDTPTDTYLFYEVKADLSEEDIKVLSKARVKRIQPGIESLATSTLKLMKKGTSAFQNISFLKNCVSNDIFPAWNLLVGFPGEEADVYRKYVVDLPLLVHLPPPYGVFPVRFDRYSPYFVKAKEYGLDLHPFDFYGMSYPFDEESLSNLAYYFRDATSNARYTRLMSEWIDRVRERVDWWQSRWHNVDQLLPPKLQFKDNSTVVYDSRSGRALERQVGDVGKQVLDFLHGRPADISRIAAGLSHLSGTDFAKEVALLRSRGLVFQEGDRYLSLVLAREAPPMTHTR